MPYASILKIKYIQRSSIDPKEMSCRRVNKGPAVSKICPLEACTALEPHMHVISPENCTSDLTGNKGPADLPPSKFQENTTAVDKVMRTN